MIVAGLMSGTSADGIDAAVVRIEGVPPALTWHVLGHLTVPHTDELRARIFACCDPATSNAEQVCALNFALGRAFAEAALQAIRAAGLRPEQVDLIGSHGQTVWHIPTGSAASTLQLGETAVIAEITGLPVVGNFRTRDMAAGGQGAPLVPVFHEALVGGDFERPVAVLNLGGVGNVTWIGEGPANALLAFDTGPGNALIDDWLRATTGRPYDAGGALAASGRVDADALEALLAHPYFAAPPPKSLDRDDFAAHARAILRDRARLSPADRAATLTAFTAAAVARALDHMPARPRTWIVAGGGSHNATLLHELRTRLGARLMTAGETGWSPDFVEAQAFAYLAARSLRGLPLTFPGTTGVARPLLGGVLAEPSGQAALSAGARPSRRSR